MAGGADKWQPELHQAVVFGMYPELEEPSKKYFEGVCKIWEEYKKDPNKSKEFKDQKIMELIKEISKEYSLNERGYTFYSMNDEQAQRVSQRTDVALRHYVDEMAEERIDPLQIVMKALSKKVPSQDCRGISRDFLLAERGFEEERNKNTELFDFFKNRFPEAYSVYEQIKKCLASAGIKDCFQIIDDKNYKNFAQTLDKFVYKGKEYNLLDTVNPILRKYDAYGKIEKQISL